MSFVFVLTAIIYVVVAVWTFFGTRKPGEVPVYMTALFSVSWPVVAVVWYIKKKNNNQ